MINEPTLEWAPTVETKDEVARIEKETKMHVPEFVSKWPTIDPEKAADFAIENGLVSKFVYRRYKNNTDGLRYFASRDGLRFCRNNETDIKGAHAIIGELQKEPLSTLDIFDMFLNRNPKDLKELAISEGYRRAKRDREVLTMETEFLGKRGIKVPDFESLIEYCGWLPESTGHNPRMRSWGWDEHYIHKANDVYWDLMQHYSQTIEGARKAFDPLHDWEKYLKGQKDITDIRSWDLQNMGEEDIGYYSMAVKWGGGARHKPSRYEDPSILITHSTPLRSAREIIQRGYLIPRVCYSVGRVVSVMDYPQLSFIFDKSIVKQTYSVEPYRESSHEEEIRSNEVNSINFAIGCVPTNEEIFFDYHGSGDGTRAIGRSTIKNWEEKYKRTGKLWSQEEIDEIRNIAGKVQEPKED